MNNMIGLYLENKQTPKYLHNNEELFAELEVTIEEEKPIVIEKIIINNLRLVRHILNKRYPAIDKVCQNIRVTYDDFFSTGTYALMKAVYTFDPSKGYKFATYATMVIHNEFGMFMRKHKRSYTDVSLYKQTHDGDNGAGDRELTLMDLLVDENNDMDKLTEQEFNIFFLKELDKVLSPREVSILRMHFYDELTQKQLANQLGISQSYISRILRSTVAKARNLYYKIERV